MDQKDTRAGTFFFLKKENTKLPALEAVGSFPLPASHSKRRTKALKNAGPFRKILKRNLFMEMRDRERFFWGVFKTNK